MAEENYHELDLEETQASIALDSYTSSVASSLAEEYTSYASSAETMLDSYYSEADLSGSEGGSNSESEFSERSNHQAGGQNSFYTGVLTEQMEKEIDYLPIRDWQGELQALLMMADSHEKFRGIARLGLDFQHAASLYARVIVSECKLPDNQKTIKTADVGGVAGGFKVICQGILFKVAIDKHGMYGSDANAAKAAGHEFKSSTAFFDLQLPDVQIPLMAIIDYRGFRVTAMSLLPISGQETLVYGSADGGRSVMASDPAFNELMEAAGKLLNLKPHLCGRFNPQVLYMPIDVEGHVTLKFKTKAAKPKEEETDPITGLSKISSSEEPVKSGSQVTAKAIKKSTDPPVPFKRSYVMLDLARLFPPQMPLRPPEKGSKHRSYLYELLRPEYVKGNPVPLSSDAFSPFNATDPDSKKNNEEVAAACQRLVSVRVPQFAAFMEKASTSSLNSIQDLNCGKLIAQLHRHGVNIRFLGLVRRCLQHPKLRQVALTEMVARVIKDQINEILRNTTEKVQLPVEEPYREAVTDYLNRLFSNAHNSEDFWKRTIQPAVLTKFSLKKLDLASKDTPLVAVENADLDDKNVKGSSESVKSARPLRTSTRARLAVQQQQQEEEPNLRYYVEDLQVWERVSELTGVILRRDSLNVMSSGLGISSSDIKALTSRIRITDVVNSALAISVSMDAKQKRGTEAFRLYLRANQLFNECLEVSASNANTFYHWGIMLHEMAQHTYFRKRQNSLRLLKQGALPKLAQAVHLNSSFWEAHAELAWTLLDFLLHPARFEAVNTSTSHKAALKDTTAILERVGHHLSISLRASSNSSIKLKTSASKSTPNIISSLTASTDSEPSGEKSKKKKKSSKSSKVPSTTDPDAVTSIDLATSEEMKEMLDIFLDRVDKATDSMFCALMCSLEKISPLQPYIAARGTELTEIDINDASFLPKNGFVLITRRCPNLTVFKLRNAVFLDAVTAGEMLRSDEEWQPTNATLNATVSNTDLSSTSSAATGGAPAPMVGAIPSATSSPSLSAFSLSKLKAKFGATPPPSALASSTGSAHQCFLPSLKRLKKIKFSCCDHLTDIEGFEKIFWPELESLQFDKAGLSDGFFSSRLDPRMLPSLTHINMSGTSVTDPSLTKIAQQFGSQLACLELKVCLNLQFASCFCIMVQNPSLLGLKSLTELNLSGCRGFAANAFSQFVKALPLPGGPTSRWHSHRASQIATRIGNKLSSSSSTSSNQAISSSSSTSSGSVPTSIVSPPASITSLNLDGCSLISEDSWNLLPKKLPHLKSISMEKSQASGTTLALLGTHCPRLEHLHAPACKGLDPVSLLKVLQGCPNLTYLDASFWVWNKAELEPKLSKAWTTSALPLKLELRQLFVCAWPVDTMTLQMLYMRCPSLTSTDISGCSVGPELIATTLTTHCKQLEKLVASGFSVTDEAVDALTQECKTLRILSITKAHDITDNALQSLCRCSHLVRLNCSHSPFITNSGIQMLVTAVPTLTRLGLKGSKLITSAFVFEKLRHSCVELNIEMDSGKSIPWSFPLT